MLFNTSYGLTISDHSVELFIVYVELIKVTTQKYLRALDKLTNNIRDARYFPILFLIESKVYTELI